MLKYKFLHDNLRFQIKIYSYNKILIIYLKIKYSYKYDNIFAL